MDKLLKSDPAQIINSIDAVEGASFQLEATLAALSHLLKSDSCEIILNGDSAPCTSTGKALEHVGAAMNAAVADCLEALRRVRNDTLISTSAAGGSLGDIDFAL